ncbi:MAG: MFS family permease [Halioglobus sp.]|jgi:MFS family permease
MTLCGIGAFQSIARWLELLAFGIYVFDLTGSPFLVALVTVLKLAPLAIFGPLIGAWTANVASRNLYLLGLTLVLLTSLAGATAASFGDLVVWQVMLISFLGGVFWALDFPIRRTLIGEAVSPNEVGKAMGLDTISNNAMRMLGALLGGTMLQFWGLQGVFLFTFILYSLCFALTLKLQLGRKVLNSTKSVGLKDNIQEGIQLVRQNPVLSATLMVSVIYNLFGFPMLSLMPVLGRDELSLPASIIGLLGSMEGLGALLGGILFFLFGQIRFFRKIYACGVAAGLLFGLVYAASNSAQLMGCALFLMGASSACFAAMQTTLLVLNSDSRYRSQIFGLMAVSIGTGIAGFSQIGVMATWIGVRPALFTSATLGLFSLVLVCRRWPQILESQPG